MGDLDHMLDELRPGSSILYDDYANMVNLFAARVRDLEAEVQDLKNRNEVLGSGAIREQHKNKILKLRLAIYKGTVLPCPKCLGLETLGLETDDTA